MLILQAIIYGLVSKLFAFKFQVDDFERMCLKSTIVKIYIACHIRHILVYLTKNVCAYANVFIAKKFTKIFSMHCTRSVSNGLFGS